MIKKERRASDTNGERGIENRRFFNNGTIVKMMVALLFGSGATGGISILASEDKETIELNRKEVILLNERLTSQEKVFDAKLEALNVKIDAVDGKLDLLLRRTEK